ncbi:GNAT family N-acetyltransferase [Fluviicola sp.]|uniref:GNAT family N-acetyltransferase n=1 Tax=Fluviicola sp. TaxID=1917219 RepID=UPI0031D4D5B8
MDQLIYKLANGEEISSFIPQLGQLRMSVFYDFPYLYEGNLEYEQHYLQIYTRNPLSIAFGVFDGDRLIGATTGMPLTAEDEAIQKPFKERRLNLDEIFYFGESILLPEYRGMGLGHQFFDVREEHALKNGFRTTTFCSVVRPEDHPLKPQDHRPNDVFWTKRGYVKQDFSCTMSWLDRNETEETEKELIFWQKEWK